jgi:hypothetical protein
VAVSEVGVLSATEISLSGSGAVVHSDDERWWTRKPGGLVDKHLHAGGVSAEVADLLELTSGGADASDAQSRQLYASDLNKLFRVLLRTFSLVKDGVSRVKPY